MPRSRTADADAVRFGAILRRLRLERGWTLATLAQRAGLHAAYVSILEQGGNVPSLSTVLELLEVLGADAGAVMSELAATRTARRPAAATAAPPADEPPAAPR